MPTLAAPLDYAKLESRNERIHQLSTAPAAPVTGQMYYNTTDNTFYWWNGTAWRSADASSGAGGPPTGSAGGDLAGSTYPNPVIAAGVITDTKVAAANKDGVVGTACMRTLGLGAQQALAGTTRLDTITSPTGSVNMSSQKIIALATPTTGTDAATKAYVDSVAQGLDVKVSCHAASTANVTVSTAPSTLDGVTLSAQDRVLLKDQTTQSENGIYTFASVGTPLVRATDADISTEVTPGMFTFVEEGTANSDTGWILTTNAPITIGTTSLVFTQFSGAGTITAGTGLTQTGSTINAVGTAARISVAADSIDIDAAYVGQATITTLGTVATGTWNATTIAVAKGGTGATTAPAARTNLGAAGVYTSATHGASATISYTQATHGLTATRGLLVQCQIDATGAVILPDVVVAANGDVTITFSVSQSANTIRTTIIG